MTTYLIPEVATPLEAVQIQAIRAGKLEDMKLDWTT